MSAVGRIVPISSPYGAPVLFVEKKRGGGLGIFIGYIWVNVNIIVLSWLFFRINDLMARSQGAYYFSKLFIRNSIIRYYIEGHYGGLYWHSYYLLLAVGDLCRAWT